MASKPASIDDYLASLPADRRAAMTAVRALVRKHLPKGYVEHLSSSWLAWSVPLAVYPDTYNGHPLMYAALVNQKNYVALHLVCAYMSPVLQQKLVTGFKSAGKRLDMGKACIRFKRVEDLALEPIAEVVAAVPMEKYVAIAKQAHSPEARRERAAKRAAKPAARPAAKQSAKKAAKKAAKQAAKKAAKRAVAPAKRNRAARPK
ncbi:MAG: DUF1801 domain-containing protein [Candidatus Eisenbacteria bacterium]